MPLSNVFQWFNRCSAKGPCGITDGIYQEKEFRRILNRERARAERSDHRFSLVLFKAGKRDQGEEANDYLLRELQGRLRVTDEAGWVQKNSIGAILYNTTGRNAWSFANSIRTALLSAGFSVSCKVYAYPPPPNSQPGVRERRSDSSLSGGKPDEETGKMPAPEILQVVARKISLEKRCIDIIGSFIGLVLLFPLLMFIGVFIKIVSPGPMLYKQVRIGVGGRPFTFWKFRTMKVNADTTGHQHYLADLIHGEEKDEDQAKPMAKLDMENPDIIPFGKVLRKSYLDEFPQLINVLRGEMSLIGPRPPIPYEVEEYKLWHNGRLDVVPGMTGLWQVSGKNLLTFEQMVRLDIQYIRQQSFLLDMRILFKTPIAIASELKSSLSKLRYCYSLGAEETKLS